MISKSLRHPSFWLLLLGATLVLSSCGSSGVTERGANIRLPVSTPTPSSPGTEEEWTGVEAQKFSFEVYGENPSIVTAELTTDNLLQARITAQSGGRNLGTNQYTNFSAQYNCATFKVVLEIDNGSGWSQVAQQTTSPLKVPGTSGCTGSKDSQTINFSSYLFPGDKRARFKIQAMRSDFYCQLYTGCVNFIQRYGYVSSDCTWMAGQTNMQQYVCPLKDIYQYHTVNGTVEMQVNGTSLR
jgi:hypothetical protein